MIFTINTVTELYSVCDDFEISLEMEMKFLFLRRDPSTKIVGTSSHFRFFWK